MAVYQGSLTVKRRAKDGGPGKPGKDGIDIQIDNPNLIVTENSGSRDYSKTGFKIKVVQGGHSFNYFGADMTVLQERSWTCEIIEANNITGFTPPGPYPEGVTNAVFPPITDLSGDAGYIVLRFHIRDATMVYQFVDRRIQYNLSGKPGKDAINIHIDSTNLVILESGGERDYSNTGLKIRITQGGWDLDYMGISAAHPGSWLCSVAESSNVTGFTIPIGGVGVYDLNIPPITELTGSSGYIVLRFDITDRYGVRQFVDRRIQYTVTGRGYDGMPGQVPIQKEWVVGDTHRFNDEIKDYIYVRGASGNTSYWYTRTSKGPDVVAGAAPVGGANKEGYTRVDWLKTLAVNVLLAEEANLANFVFKKEQLISVRGTVNGDEDNYSGQENFKPYIILDGKSGKIYAEGAEITGKITGTDGSFGGWEIKNGALVSSNGRILIDAQSNRIDLLDSNGNVKTSIKPTDIPSSVSSYFGSGGILSGSLSDIKLSNSSTSTVSTSSVSVDASGGKSFIVRIPAFTLTATAQYGGSAGGSSYTEVRVFLTNGSVEDQIGGIVYATSFGTVEQESISFEESLKIISSSGSWRLKVVKTSYTFPTGQSHSASWSFASSATYFTIEEVVERSEIGSNGMMIATSASNYNFMVGGVLEFRRGNFGFRISASGFQKMTNGSTWSAASNNIE